MGSILLNSGGLDSTVLAYGLANAGIADVYSLFFNYKQPNLIYERNCAKTNAKELGMDFIEIKLPKFTWTAHNFYEKDDYLEMRNLIFLSYALSIAEAKGADTVYAAVRQYKYADCTTQFTQLIGSLSLCTSGITIEFPYLSFEIENMVNEARKLGITRDKFFSCNSPKDGKPCGICEKCISLQNILER